MNVSKMIGCSSHVHTSRGCFTRATAEVLCCRLAAALLCRTHLCRRATALLLSRPRWPPAAAHPPPLPSQQCTWQGMHPTHSSLRQSQLPATASPSTEPTADHQHIKRACSCQAVRQLQASNCLYARFPHILHQACKRVQHCVHAKEVPPPIGPCTPLIITCKRAAS